MLGLLLEGHIHFHAGTFFFRVFFFINFHELIHMQLKLSDPWENHLSQNTWLIIP